MSFEGNKQPEKEEEERHAKKPDWVMNANRAHGHGHVGHRSIFVATYEVLVVLRVSHLVLRVSCLMSDV